jgi:hypothetical protein
MTFDDIPTGAAVFVDANTFVASNDADFDRVSEIARYAPV